MRKAMAEGINETVERITVGMNIQDIREALRGEPPSRRPNPRLQPHADGFWLHMRPGYYHRDVTGVYPTFRLGWLSTYFVVFETITGVLLMGWYTPSPQIAYGNMLSILNNVPLGQFMRDMHRLGAEAMVIIVALHMMRTWITGSYKKPRQFTWFTGLILLVLTGLLSFTGYLLPWDQLSLWAVTIGASMTEATPVIGEQVNLIFRGAPELGANGLLRFYLVHVLLLPLILYIFVGVHYYKVIIHGHSLPPQLENIGEDTAKRVPLDKRVYYIPDILTNEITWIAVTTLIMTILCIWFYHAPLENHANPQVTPLGTTAPWYFLWIQGALKLGDKFFWGLVFPTAMLGLLAAIPYLDVGPSRRYAHRRWMLSAAMGLISFATILSYMGLPEFAVATAAETEILHDLTKEPAHNAVGAARTIPFDQAVVGMYTTEQFEAVEGQSERDAVAQFEADLRETYNLYTTGQIEALGEGTDPAELTIRETSVYGAMETALSEGHLASGSIPARFSLVPSDAPELAAVLHELKEEIENRSRELPNAWGAIIITPAQGNLRRIDLVISWDTVVVDAGEPEVDENGNPVYVYQTDPVTDETLLDENGEPIIERSVATEHIYLHEDSAYFD
ncbi:cytochrome bc complex cytochrome b subunit [Phototrophicus methaneseepsis]|uniref:Cytochrome bc complex cytochrome b subunit n=1 Tax=Phototrophicus methaneseepsis TaxID=2710758 RepID=A0A7S8E828_9CHLR|nr:cytochrome bc complex cytochrome b subunit [Phototrophicus methaneseepsis]QPC82074.1 cytochrome bc complex cytochrome b subunit [Phototrophicus methaneseepsis]